MSAFAVAVTVLVAASQAAPSPTPPAVPGYPVGWCIRARPEVFAAAKSAGFEYVELALQDVLGLTDGEFAALAASLRSTGLRALSGYNPIPKEIVLVGPDASVPTQDEHLRRLLPRAKALDLTYVIFNSGAAWRVPDGVPADRAFAQLAAFGRRFAEAADRQGLTVLLEPMRSTDSNMITTIAEAVRLVETVDHPRFQMMVDYSFVVIQKDDVSALVKAGRHLRHVHVANPMANRTYPMDDGESDYASFFRVLKQIGYRGGLSVHASTKAFATDAPRAIAFLRAQGRGLAAGSAGK